MKTLFDAAHTSRIRPLAEEARPLTLDEVIGQRHLLAPGTIFRRNIDSGRIGSVILSGPPGVGKTTIALAIGAALNTSFVKINAVNSGVSDLKAVIEESKIRSLTVFVDEIHKFNVSVQRTLLDAAEDGLFNLISATSQNPSFAVDGALISRSASFKLNPLSVDETLQVLRRGIKHLQSKRVFVEVHPDVLTAIAGRSSGDGRRALIALEFLVAGTKSGDTAVITEGIMEDYFRDSPIAYDRAGDHHYNVISAFVKSMRGSDPDATLYWLARLIEAGENPEFIARRIVIHASEDVGLADSTALHTAMAAFQAVRVIGMPEARIILSHAALHVARAPKSNAACRGIGMAQAYVKSQPDIHVPPHLRDTHYAAAAAQGAGGYVFPHDFPEDHVEQDYAPGIEPGTFYQSDARGGATFEKRADDFWAKAGRNPIRRF